MPKDMECQVGWLHSSMMFISLLFFLISTVYTARHYLNTIIHFHQNKTHWAIIQLLRNIIGIIQMVFLLAWQQYCFRESKSIKWLFSLMCLWVVTQWTCSRGWWYGSSVWKQLWPARQGEKETSQLIHIGTVHSTKKHSRFTVLQRWTQQLFLSAVYFFFFVKTRMRVPP